MTTYSTSDQILFTVPFTHTTDFTELADNCERFVDVLVECDDPAQKMALCGRLSACLSLLQPTLRDPIPEHLKASLTVDDLPSSWAVFEPEADQLGEYCQTLTQLLMSGALSVNTERVMSDLLFDLVSYFAGILKAPRWLKTEKGTIALEEMH